MSDAPRPPHSDNSPKNRALRVDLAYHRHRDHLRSAKHALGWAALILVPIGWAAVGSDAASAPGPVRHWQLAAAASEFESKGCNGCHEPWAHEVPSTKMCAAECHQDVVATHAHGFGKWGDAAPASVPEELQSCAGCHFEHREGRHSPAPDQTAALCGRCHGDEQGLPDVPTAIGADKDRRPLPVHELRLAFHTFSHKGHLDPKLDAKLACSDCHEKRSGSAPEGGVVYAGQFSQFEPVRFEKCRTCHDKGVGKAPVYNVSWHGTQDRTKCLQCHAELHAKDLATVGRERTASPRWFDIVTRPHVHDADLDKDCRKCHVNGDELAGARRIERRFPHDLHLTSFEQPEQCKECHDGVMESNRLGGDHAAYESHSCARCHRESARTPVEGDAMPAESLVAEAGSLATKPADSADFPHKLHAEVACTECHTFETLQAGGESGGVRLATTTANARSCLPCHQGHGEFAGGSCRKCHKDGDSAYWGASDPTKLATWRRPVDTKFDHWSAGHVEWTESQRCAECHDAVPGRKLSESTTLAAVPIPTEAEPVCTECHIEQRQRFHFRAR